MSETSGERPEAVTGATPVARAPRRWRLATPVVVTATGVLFAVSAANSDGTDLRPGRYPDLASFVATESRAYDALATRVSELTEEVDDLSGRVESAQVSRARARADALRGPAGLLPVSGPGVAVVLSDSPSGVVDAALADGDVDLDRLVVHQQDIQAVVNALWQGGASAVTVEGQRIISTTGIKCEGNAVQLQGIPYPQPYEIEAVGDPERLTAALQADDYVALYRTDAADPAIDIGFDFAALPEVQAPAYDGLLDLSYAEPVR